MSASYAYLCRKAGLPDPGSQPPVVKMPARARRPRLTAEQEKAILRHELDRMVEEGRIKRTTDGRYCL